LKYLSTKNVEHFSTSTTVGFILEKCTYHSLKVNIAPEQIVLLAHPKTYTQ